MKSFNSVETRQLQYVLTLFPLSTTSLQMKYQQDLALSG